MELINSIFNVEDLTSQFTVMDVVLVLILSFLLSAFLGWVYMTTHRGTSYTQSFVFSLVINGMVVALVMLIVGSNVARAFSLVGALSIVRFRNAVKETRDVGFIFFAMAIGMAVGTRFSLSGHHCRRRYQSRNCDHDPLQLVCARDGQPDPAHPDLQR